MAMAAMLGLTTAEAIGLSCCDHLSVTSENRDFLRLLERTGLPSIEEMAMRDACSVIKQVFKIQPSWFTMGTARQQTKSKLSGALPISGVHPTFEGTLIQEILALRDLYYEKYGKQKLSTERKIDEIKIHYERVIKKARRDNKRGKEISDLYRKRNEELLVLGTPVLKRYFLAREQVIELNPEQKINYAHLLRTYTLSCREEFNSLDMRDREHYFKTPKKNKPNKTIKATCKKHVPISMRCDKLSDEGSICIFCDKTLHDIKSENSRYSHLIFECSAIPGLGPLPKSLRPPEKIRMRRLAEIGAIPDPGGQANLED